VREKWCKDGGVPVYRKKLDEITEQAVTGVERLWQTVVLRRLRATEISIGKTIREAKGAYPRGPDRYTSLDLSLHDDLKCTVKFFFFEAPIDDLNPLMPETL